MGPADRHDEHLVVRIPRPGGFDPGSLHILGVAVIGSASSVVGSDDADLQAAQQRADARLLGRWAPPGQLLRRQSAARSTPAYSGWCTMHPRRAETSSGIA